jgi:tight adherence protein B
VNFDSIYLVYGFLGLGCFLLVEGVYYLLVDTQGRRRDPNRRLRMLASGKTRDEVAVSLRRQRNFTSDRGPLVWFESLVIQSGIGAGLMRVTFLMFGLGGVALILTYLVRGDLLSGIVAGIAAGLLLPLLVLLAKRRRRMRRFERQFPDAVEMMVRGLRAGHPVTSALSLVAREMTDPIGTEFGITLDELTYGFELDRALKNLRGRVGLPDVSFLVVAVSIQIQLGGNLAEVLSNLARVIRERLKMKLKIKAASAEGRFSAIVLSIVPFALIGILTALNPGFYGEVKDDPIFMPVLGGAFILMIFGIFVMWRLVNFRV